MSSQQTFYLSQVIGSPCVSLKGVRIGIVKDLLIEIADATDENEPIRPKVIALRLKSGGELKDLDFLGFDMRMEHKRPRFTCSEMVDLPEEESMNALWLMENIMDKQILDINGRKLVRVNDVRLVMIPSGTFAIAVDVGIKGLLRRIGILKPVRAIVGIFGRSVPSRYILWDDIEAVDFSSSSIRLSTTSSRLKRLHPSDLADIIEELDKVSRTYVFTALDDEQAADVLEELEPNAQAHLVETLPVEKMADVLEKMPADEVADLLDVVEDDQAEKLLEEMEKESSEEVRELLEYSENLVGSVMSTDYYTFHEELTVSATLEELRKLKPEPAHIYSLFVTDRHDRFTGSLSLGELVIADPGATLGSITAEDPVSVFDNDRVDSLAELVSKYNLLAVPVINKERKMEGVVMVEDIVDDLLGRRKTK